MPTWGGILAELTASQENNNGVPDFDGIRRKYLVSASRATGRDLILYATNWTSPGSSPDVSINDEDLQGLMEVVHGLTNPNLDLILHSPGGSIDAAEGFVQYLRSKFDHIRVIVPQQAMSAATMIACASDVIMLGKHSFLGPIDPQFAINTPLGYRMIPAEAVIEQFRQAQAECQDPKKLAAWLPMLNQYGPDLLVQSENASKLSKSLVREWLAAYMFKNDPSGKKKARKIADWLASHKRFKSHGRHIPRMELESRGFIIEPLEGDQNLQDLFLSVYHAVTHTFAGTGVVKIIENHIGKAFLKIRRAQP